MLVDPNDSTPRLPPEKMFVIAEILLSATSTVPIKKQEVNPVPVIVEADGGVDDPVLSIVTTYESVDPKVPTHLIQI